MNCLQCQFKLKILFSPKPLFAKTKPAESSAANVKQRHTIKSLSLEVLKDSECTIAGLFYSRRCSMIWNQFGGTDIQLSSRLSTKQLNEKSCAKQVLLTQHEGLGMSYSHHRNNASLIRQIDTYHRHRQLYASHDSIYLRTSGNFSVFHQLRLVLLSRCALFPIKL